MLMLFKKIQRGWSLKDLAFLLRRKTTWTLNRKAIHATVEKAIRPEAGIKYLDLVFDAISNPRCSAETIELIRQNYTNIHLTHEIMKHSNTSYETLLAMLNDRSVIPYGVWDNPRAYRVATAWLESQRIDISGLPVSYARELFLLHRSTTSLP